MEWLKSKTTIVAFGSLALVALQGYIVMSMRSTLEERMNSIEGELRSMDQEADEKVMMLSSDLDLVTKKMGITEQELEQAQTVAKQLKQENTQLARRLRSELSTKADSKAVLKYQEEATNRLNAVHQEATSKIDGVTGQVRGVRTDLDAARVDINSTRTDLNATREELANNRRDLGVLIARNSTELADLRRKGERDYVEFDIRKGKQFKRVGDILVQLRSTDRKRQKYEVAINADDSAIIKKDRDR